MMKQQLRQFQLLFFLFFSLIFLVETNSGQISGGSPAIYEIKLKNRIYTTDGAVFPPQPCPKEISACPDGSTTFSIRAKKGMRLSIELTSKGDKAVFSIFSGDWKVIENASARTSWRGAFEEDGNYLIRIFTTKEHSPFKLKVLKR